MGSKIILTCALAALALPAAAYDIYRGEQTKDAYIFADAATTSVDINEPAGSEVSDGFDIANGFSFGVGYKITKRFALELSYRNFGSVNLYQGRTDNVAEFDREKADEDIDFSATQFSLVAAQPLSDTFNVYGRLGVADVSVDSSSKAEEKDGAKASVSKTKIFLGVGARSMISENSAIRVELGRYDKLGDITLSTLSVGLDCSF